MSNSVKNILKKPRDKFLGAVTDKLNALSLTVGGLEKQIGNIQRAQEVQQAHAQADFEHIKQRLPEVSTIVISEKEMITKIFSGLKVYLDPSDLAVAIHIALDGIWEAWITKAWVDVVKPNDVVIDIGANFGYFGALAAQKTNKKNSKVIFFEANPHLIPYINKTLSVNWLNEQSVVENLAVADKAGKVTLNILKGYIGSSSVHSLEHTEAYMHSKMHLEKAEAVKVDAVSIDDYCRANKIKTIDLIKMDIEGFEDKAYEGMRGMVKASPNVTLFIEFTKDSYDNPQKFYQQMLDDFGNVYVINEHGQLEVPKNTDYASIIEVSDDWVMPVFSKNKNLVKPT